MKFKMQVKVQSIYAIFQHKIGMGFAAQLFVFFHVANNGLKKQDLLNQDNKSILKT